MKILSQIARRAAQGLLALHGTCVKITSESVDTMLTPGPAVRVSRITHTFQTLKSVQRRRILDLSSVVVGRLPRSSCLNAYVSCVGD